MKKILVAFGIMLMGTFAAPTANADSCGAGYYYNDNNECVECQNNHYCTGDGTMQSCPKFTYSSTEELHQMVTGYNVHSVERAFLYSNWSYSNSQLTSINTCTLVLDNIEVVQGKIGVYLVHYSTQTDTYSANPTPLWYRANNGYYLSKLHANHYYAVKACTNSHPANSHYSGPGTPDSADGTVVDANDCPWVCDDGYYGSSAAGSNSCTLCTGATYCAGGVQTNCPIGYDYNTATGKMSINQCQANCPTGKYADNGMLPAGYTQLEYIESTGTQYINTGITVKANSLAEFEYQYVGSVTPNYVFGQIAGPGNKLMGYRSNRIWWFQANNVESNDNNRHHVVFDSDGKVYRDGTIVATRGTFSSEQNLPMLLFAESNDNNEIHKGNVKIFNFVLKEGIATVLNLIPAQRNSDNVLGMYDLVTGQFFTNAGTGTFVAGPVVGSGGGCVTCSENSYCTGGVYNFTGTGNVQGINACPAGLYAPAGMWAANQCGHILHIGDEVVYLHGVKKTSPSLHVKIGNDIFYGNMTTADVVMHSGTAHKLKVQYDNTTYSIYDDTVKLPGE